MSDLEWKIFLAKKELGEINESITKQTEALLEIQDRFFHAKLQNEKVEIKTSQTYESVLNQDMVNLKNFKGLENNNRTTTQDFDSLRLSEELSKMRKTAKKLLVENWNMPFIEDIKRIDLDISIYTESKKCESNPELNPYIRIPKFSRNRWDYNVSRKRI